MTDPDITEYLERLESNPAICGGQVCVKGTRIPASLILGALAGGETAESLLRGYPTLKSEDIAACLAYAAQLAGERILPLAQLP